MTDSVETLASRAGRVPRLARSSSRRRGSARRLLVDRLARRLVTLGGVVIIASILAILFVIVAEVYPLFKQPTATPVRRPVAAGRAAAPRSRSGSTSTARSPIVVTDAGVQFVSAQGRRAARRRVPFPGSDGATVVGRRRLGRGPFVLGTLGRPRDPARGEVRRHVHQEGSATRDARAGVRRARSASIPTGRPIRRLAHAAAPEPARSRSAAGRARRSWSLADRQGDEGADRAVDARRSRARRSRSPVDGEITALALDGRGEDLFVGTSARPGRPRTTCATRRTRGRGAVAGHGSAGRAGHGLGFLIGDRTLVVGDAAGGVSDLAGRSSRAGRRAAADPDLRRSRATPGPSSAFAPSQRDKGFVTADASGTVAPPLRHVRARPC